MQLRTARLCLDCEEIHDAQVCPICASETFSYLSRWVPASEPRRQRVQPASPEAAIHRRTIAGQNASPWHRSGTIGKGLVGLTAVGVFGWLWRSSQTTGTKKDS